MLYTPYVRERASDRPGNGGRRAGYRGGGPRSLPGPGSAARKSLRALVYFAWDEQCPQIIKRSVKMNRRRAIGFLLLASGLAVWSLIANLRVSFPVVAAVDSTYFVDQGAWLYSGLCGVLAGVSVTALVLVFQSAQAPDTQSFPARDFAARLLVGAFLSFVLGAVLWAAVASHKQGETPSALIGYATSIPAIAAMGNASLQLVAALFWVVRSLSGPSSLSDELTTLLKRSAALAFVFWLFQVGLSLGDLLFRFGFPNSSASLLTVGLIGIAVGVLTLSHSAPKSATVSNAIQSAERQLVASYAVSSAFILVTARSTILYSNARLPASTPLQRSLVLVGAFVCTSAGLFPAMNFLRSVTIKGQAPQELAKSQD